ncbi:MAG: thiamine phosphate synthase, partial [Chthoniobacterales bacterium]
MTLAGTLYAILDLGYVRDEDAPHMLRQLLEGGADIVQLRGKNRSIDELSALAKKLLPLTTAANVPLIVNDHAQIARSVNVQGVHVGQDDEAIASVRTKAGRPIIVGKSTHNLEQAIAAEGEGADYIGFGPLFATPTKPEYVPIGLADINEVQQRVSIPIFCIGGIKIENLAQVINAGAQRVVIVSGLLEAPDPADYARKAKQTLVTRHSPLAT